MTTEDLFSLAQRAASVDAEGDTEGALPAPGSSAPLAYRMRPEDWPDLLGHDRVLAPGTALRTWIETDRVPSLVFWGPPGCGKTTLARLVARKTVSHFVTLSAVHSGVKDIKEAVESAKMQRRQAHRKTILFVDEIHRFNKSQQDALLPHVEDGTVTLIGATTENPSFELNRALLSRTRVIRLDPLEPQALRGILEKAMADPRRGLGGWLRLEPEALDWLAGSSEGDARRALTALESLALYAGEGKGSAEAGAAPLTCAQVQELLQRQPIPYDKNGEEHYNVISAFIKSLRDSDPHAGLYYLARMIEAGEDPMFVARRLVILASEDVGNADPRALQVAVSTMQAVDLIGMPEGRIPLAQAVTYLASAPKSNASYVGINEALEEVRKTGALPIPMQLRNGVTSLMKGQGYGAGYQYAHDRAGAAVKQRHLPDMLLGRRFYRPKDAGLEKQIKERLDQLNPNFD
ncbi:MAG: replication-associated recombination protein A [Bdellovibrionales bacterium]|nr:replication-associated recombination protein A [Bdellovibrionales bacterium]